MQRKEQSPVSGPNTASISPSYSLLFSTRVRATVAQPRPPNFQRRRSTSGRSRLLLLLPDLPSPDGDLPRPSGPRCLLTVPASGYFSMVRRYMLPAAPVSFCSKVTRPTQAAGAGAAPGGSQSSVLFLLPLPVRAHQVNVSIAIVYAAHGNQ